MANHIISVETLKTAAGVLLALNEALDGLPLPSEQDESDASKCDSRL